MLSVTNAILTGRIRGFHLRVSPVIKTLHFMLVLLVQIASLATRSMLGLLLNSIFLTLSRELMKAVAVSTTAEPPAANVTPHLSSSLAVTLVIAVGLKVAKAETTINSLCHKKRALGYPSALFCVDLSP